MKRLGHAANRYTTHRTTGSSSSALRLRSDGMLSQNHQTPLAFHQNQDPAMSDSYRFKQTNKPLMTYGNGQYYLQIHC